MPYLKLNGLTIPARAGRIMHKEIGGRRLAFSGTPTMDRRAIKRTWRYRTTTLHGAQLAVMRKLLLGLGDSWRFRDQFSTKGVLPVSGEVAPAVGFGSVGHHPTFDFSGEPETPFPVSSDTASFMPWWARLTEPYANSFENNVRDGTDYSDDTTDFAQFGGATIASSTDVAMVGERSLKVSTTGVGQGAENTGVTLANNPYWMSVYVYSLGARDFTLDFRRGAGSAGTQSINHPGGGWYRMAVYGLTLGSVCSARVTTTTAAAGDWYLDCFQFELMSSSAGYYTNAGPAAWTDSTTNIGGSMVLPARVFPSADTTISFWIKCKTATNSPWDRVFFASSLDGTADNMCYCYHRSTVDQLWYSKVVNGVVAGSAFHVGGVEDGLWHHVCIVSPLGSDTQIYLDGVIGASSTFTVPWNYAAANDLIFGDSLAGSEWPRESIAEFLVLPYAADANLISTLADPDRQEWVLPFLHMTGDLLEPGEESVTVLPLLRAELNQPRVFDGVHDATAAALDFELSEK